MSEPLERNQVIELLDKLGSEQDEDVLAAARTLHSQVIKSGMGWEDLLVGDEPDEEDDTQYDGVSEEDEEYDEEYDDEEDDTEDDTEEDTAEPDAEFSGDETRTLGLIEKLLARDGISSELREELEEYKTDISDGEFQSSDHRYVHSLYARLTKK